MEENKNESKTNYDRALPQTIHLTIQRGSKTYHPSVTINSVSDDEYFALQKSVELQAKKLSSVSTELFKPYAQLGQTKLASFEKFAQSPKEPELVSAMQSYLHVTSKIDSVEAGNDDVLDYDVSTPVTMTFLNNGRETNKYIEFRETTADELDEYMAILADAPSKFVLASHAKQSKETRLFALSKLLKVSSDYKNDDVPAWHLTEGVSRFCNSEMARLGKSLNE